MNMASGASIGGRDTHGRTGALARMQPVMLAPSHTRRAAQLEHRPRGLHEEVTMTS